MRVSALITARGGRAKGIDEKISASQARLCHYQVRREEEGGDIHFRYICIYERPEEFQLIFISKRKVRQDERTRNDVHVRVRVPLPQPHPFCFLCLGHGGESAVSIRQRECRNVSLHYAEALR